MIHLLRSELFRLRKRPQSWILGIIMFMAVAAFYTSLTIAAFVLSDPASTEENIQLGNIFDNGMQIATLTGSILTVVFAAGLIGNEYGWNTIRPLLARASSRNALLSAKWLTLLIATTCLFLFGLVVTLLFSAVGSAVAGSFVGVSASEVGDWGIEFARIAYSQLPYTVMAFAVALISRSNAAGIAVGIGCGIVETLVWSLISLMTDAFDSVRKFGIEYPSALLSNMDPGLDDPSTGELWRAALVLTFWIVLMVSATYWVFNRRDVTSG
jgi:ABC-2 type transport system permease protein